MTVENIISLVVPDKSESGQTSKENTRSSDSECSILPNDHKTSIGSSLDAKNSRRNSAGKPISQDSNQKFVPHYLRASTGSCHDFCKYGQKNTFGAKERCSFEKRTIKATSDKQNPAVTVAPVKRKRTTKSSSDKQISVMTVGTAAPVERKKSVLVKHTTSPDGKTVSLKHTASPDASHSADPPEIIKREVLPRPKKLEVSSKQDPSSDKKTPKSNKCMNIFSKKFNPSVQPQLVEKSSSSCSSESGKKTLKAEKNVKILSVKSSPTLGPQLMKGKSSSSFHTPESTYGRGRMNDEIKSRKTVVASKPPAKKKLSFQTTSLSSGPSISRTIGLNATRNRSLKSVSPLKEQSRMRKAGMEETNSKVVFEKTLHVVAAESKNKLSESTGDSDVVPSFLHNSSPSMSEVQFSLFSSHEGVQEKEVEEEEEEEGEGEECGYTYRTDKGFISDDNKNAKINDAKVQEGNQTKTPNKCCGVMLEAEDFTPVKLKFRRGKAVDRRSEINGPRRLLFRRGRAMEENLNCKNEIKRRNFKNKEIDGDGNVINLSNENVILRRPDMEGKKDAQGLFNNVIEETTSKLVESKKSKVKALVGAFETVISLQDTKHAPKTVE